MGEELIILDQHGAHDRIFYEKLLQNIHGTPATLPAPTVVRLPDDLAPEVWNFETETGAWGFRVEPFGGEAVRLHAAPEAVTDPEGTLLRAVEALAGAARTWQRPSPAAARRSSGRA